MNTTDSTKISICRDRGADQSVAGVQKKRLENNPESQDLKKACREFEEIFIRLILKEAKIDQFSMGGKGASQLYGDLTRETLAKSMAQAGGLGLAEVLYRQLSKGETVVTDQDNAIKEEKYQPTSEE